MGEVSRLLPVSRCQIVIAVVSWLLISTSGVRAQDNPFGGSLSLDTFRGASEPALTATLTPANAKPGDEVRLSLRLVLPAGSNTYSQDPAFESPTKITLSENVGLVPLDDKFASDHPPKRAYDKVFKKELEKFTDEVTWTKRFRLQEDVPTDGVYVRGKIDYLVCTADECKQRHDSFAVSLTGAPVPPPPAKSAAPPAAEVVPAQPVVYRQQVRPVYRVGGEERNEPASLSFELSPEAANVGDTVTLAITMDIDEHWHGFSLTKGVGQVGKPTEITLSALHNLEPLGEFRETPEPTLLDGTERTHHGRVTWSRDFKVAAADTYGVAGSIRVQVCDEGTQCRLLKPISFALGVQSPTPTAARGATDTAPLPAAVGETVTIRPFTLLEAEPPSSLLMNLVFAFLGGLILNVMPCVLPVIAIKVLSFVQQAGESRGRILALNAAYALGVMAVFLGLAVLAVFLGFGREKLFQSSEFNLVMAAVVFAMGLSLLGVFEIPVPGMLGSTYGGAHREGLGGAFVTGIFATLLATPCSGPFMGTTLAWSVKQPWHTALLVWWVMGLGMASPYLVIGAAPKLVNWLPRPGMWMVRFKEFAGFVLMGAVIWLMNSLNQDKLIPGLIILVGIALGLWMIGNLYEHSATNGKKWTVRVFALVLSGVICGYGWRLQYRSHELPWGEFSTAEIEKLRSEGKPILIDFTANWCGICKSNELTALNRPTTIDFVNRHGIVTRKADFTNEDPEIARWLAMCNQDTVPLTLIFPTGRSDQAIPLRGAYTQTTLLEKLRQAVSGGVATEQITQVPADSGTTSQVLPASEGAAAMR